MKLNDETLLLHEGYTKDGSTNACAVPIFQSASYLFNSSEHAANLFELKEFGNIYTRLTNPTTEVLEKRVTALEGGVGALAVASGQAAITYAILNIAQAGDEIISLNNLYGGTYTLFKYTFAKFGIKVHFVDSSNIQEVKNLINKNTKAIYAESIGNPKLNITDIKELSTIAHNSNLPLIIDNTTTPYIFKPFEYGADVVVYSATKFLGGHGTSLGGIIVDSGNFDWGIKENNEFKFPLIAQKDKSYHDKDFIKSFGKLAYILKARVTLLRDLGACISPFNSFLLLQGLETLHLRMQAHTKNALEIVKFLQNHKKVKKVIYPTIFEDKNKISWFKGAPGAIVGIELDGGIESGKEFINGLKVFSHLANIGDAKSLAIHPASTTHQQLSKEERLASGVSDSFIRLSIGIENSADLIDDLSNALEQIK